jgi:hypothetical protein
MFLGLTASLFAAGSLINEDTIHFVGMASVFDAGAKGDADAGGGCTIATFTGTLLDYMGADGEVLHNDDGLSLSDDGGSLAIDADGTWDKTPQVGTLVNCVFSGVPFVDGIYEITAASDSNITIDLSAVGLAAQTVSVWIGGAFPDIATAVNDSTLSEDPDSTYRKRSICVNVKQEVAATQNFVAESSENDLRTDDGSRKVIGFYDSIAVVNPGDGGGTYGYRVVSDMDAGETYYAGALTAFQTDESFTIGRPNGKWIEWDMQGNASIIIELNTSNFELRNIKLHNSSTASLYHVDTENFNIQFINCWFATAAEWQENDLIVNSSVVSDCYFDDSVVSVHFRDFQTSVLHQCIFNGAAKAQATVAGKSCLFIGSLFYEGVVGLENPPSVMFISNIFFGQTAACIKGTSSGHYLTVYYNNIFSPAATTNNAIWFTTGGGGGFCRSNIMYSVVGAGVLTVPIKHDQITPNPALPPGTLEVDPLLFNPSNGDFRLHPGSPALNAGLNTLFDGKTSIGIWQRISIFPFIY